MATYTIVASGTDPLGPNQIEAGQFIQVSDGDSFIISPSADSNITFQAAGGGPANFDISFADTNTNSFNIKVEDDLTPNITVPDNADLSAVNIDATSADAVIFSAGDNVSFGQYSGSHTGSDDITIGNGYTTIRNWTTGGGDDSILIGDDATLRNIDTGVGNDTVEFGDRATFHSIDTKEGNDSVRFGDDAQGNEIKTSAGDDSIYLGDNAQVSSIDGGADNDTYTTETTGTNSKNMESTTIVCYAPGTLIDTLDGPRAVETLRPGDLISTADHGPQPIRWVRSGDYPLEEVEVEDKPVLIQAGALGAGRPAQDLIVSPQHRVLVGGGGQLDGWFKSEAFAPAKSLTAVPGIRHMKGKQSITWVHFACDRHELVLANGCYSESLLLGPMVVNGLTNAERKALKNIYGVAPTPDAALNGPAAKDCLKVGEAQRHIAKCKEEKERRTAKEIKKWDRDLAIEELEADRLGLPMVNGQIPEFRIAC